MQIAIGAVVLVVVAYALLQPRLNQWFGWHLPGLPIAEEQADQPDRAPKNDKALGKEGTHDKQKLEQNSSDASNKNLTVKQTSKKSTTLETSNDKQTDAPLGELKEIRRNVFESTAGLIYGPGSQQGHRTKHVLEHAKDQPNRQGSHGVFDGGEDQVFATIDEAYLLVKQNSPQVKQEVDGDRTVYEVNMKRRIGFVGGQTGRRTGKPAANYVRLVLEDREVITAFPFKP